MLIAFDSVAFLKVLFPIPCSLTVRQRFTRSGGSKRSPDEEFPSVPTSLAFHSRLTRSAGPAPVICIVQDGLWEKVDEKHFQELKQKYIQFRFFGTHLPEIIRLFFQSSLNLPRISSRHADMPFSPLKLTEGLKGIMCPGFSFSLSLCVTDRA